jgi:hypothetical protein
MIAVLALLLGGLVWVSGCLAQAPDDADTPAASRVIAMWDPLHCTDDHRVVVELEDEDGVHFSRSAPCVIGSVTLDVPHWGFYSGLCYAWSAERPMVRTTDLALAADAPIIHWQIVNPP